MRRVLSVIVLCVLAMSGGMAQAQNNLPKKKPDTSIDSESLAEWLKNKKKAS